jgi:hypothetical protein
MLGIGVARIGNSAGGTETRYAVPVTCRLRTTAATGSNERALGQQDALALRAPNGLRGENQAPVNDDT